MLTLFIRAMIIYVIMIITMRALGRRQLGEFQPYEFAMTILLAEVIASPMESVSVPFIQGLLPVAGMFVIHCAISIICMKSDKARAVISGKPSIVISKGVVDEKELKRLCLNLSDLMEGIRSCGIMDPADVGTAVVEANGSIAAFPRSSCRSPTNSEMKIDAGYEGIPMILIMDGRIQEHNVIRCGRDTAWLKDCLARIDMTPADTYFAHVDTKGMLTAQKRGGEMHRIQAIDPGEVMW